MKAQLAQARHLAARGEYAKATALLRSQLDLPLRERDRARILALLAHHLPRQGELHEALRRASEAVALSSKIDDAALMSASLISLGYVYAQYLMGREALDTTWQGLHEARRAGRPDLEAWALNRLGLTCASLGHPEQGCHYTEQALEIAQGPQADHELRFSCLNNLAFIWLQVHEEARREQDRRRAGRALEQATHCAEQSLRLGRQMDSRFCTAIALSNLAEARLFEAPSPEVLPLIEEYEALARTHGYPDLQVQARLQRALILSANGRLGDAIAELRALDQQAGPTPRRRRQLCRALYLAYKDQGQFEQALHYHETLAELERQVARDTMALQTEAMLIRQEFRHAQARAEHALQDARQARERASQLEREQAQLREQAAEWGRMAHEDALTGLHNRRHAEFALPLLLERARTDAVPVALAMLDIDHFKHVNDTLGHGTGDRVLQQVALLLRSQLRGADLIARVGGEEFMLVFVGTPPDLALEVCERLLRAVRAHGWGSLAPALRITVSMGLACGEPGQDPRALVEAADQALYGAKRGGRDQVVLQRL